MQSSLPIPSLEVRRHHERTVLCFTGCNSLDEHNSEAVRRHLDLLPEVAAGDFLVLDLGGIRYVSSTGLGVLLGLNRRARSAGGRLVLANVTPFVRDALAITRLDGVIEVLPADSLAPPSALLEEPLCFPLCA